MGGTRRSEDFAGEAVLQLDCLAIDDDLLGPGRRPVAGAAISHVLRKTEKQIHKNCKKSTISFTQALTDSLIWYYYVCGIDDMGVLIIFE